MIWQMSVELDVCAHVGDDLGSGLLWDRQEYGFLKHACVCLCDCGSGWDDWLLTGQHQLKQCILRMHSME